MRSAQQSADFLLLIPLRVCLVSSVPRKSPGNSSSLLSSGREACTQWRAGSRKKKKKWKWKHVGVQGKQPLADMQFRKKGIRAGVGGMTQKESLTNTFYIKFLFKMGQLWFLYNLSTISHGLATYCDFQFEAFDKMYCEWTTEKPVLQTWNFKSVSFWCFCS